MTPDLVAGILRYEGFPQRNVCRIAPAAVDGCSPHSHSSASLRWLHTCGTSEIPPYIMKNEKEGNGE